MKHSDFVVARFLFGIFYDEDFTFKQNKGVFFNELKV